MNPVVTLIAAIALGVAWFLVSRAYAPTSQVSKEDPAGVPRRREIIRALWALAFLCLVWFVVSTAVIFGLSLIFAIATPPLNRTFEEAFSENINSATGAIGLLSPLSLGGAIASVLASLIAVGLAQRIARDKTLWDVGFRYYKGLPSDVFLGLILGPLLFAFIFQLQNLAGFILGNTGPVFDWSALAQWVIIFGCAAVAEEVIVRGYLLQTINEVWGGLPAVIVTSMFWGFAHLFNPNANLLGVLNIIVAGLVFAYAYSLSGHLWLPIAFHFSWNFAEGAIFGFPVSGFNVSNSIFQPFVSGPPEFTGGRFGPEGGLVSLIAISLAGLILFGWDYARRSPNNDSLTKK